MNAQGEDVRDRRWSATAERVRDARHFVGETVAAETSGACDDDVRLVTSELVTNAVVHARTPFTVSVACTGRIVLIEVTDGSKAFRRVTPSGRWRAFRRQFPSAHHGGQGPHSRPSGRLALGLGGEAGRQDGMGDPTRTRRYAAGLAARARPANGRCVCTRLGWVRPGPSSLALARDLEYTTFKALAGAGERTLISKGPHHALLSSHDSRCSAWRRLSHARLRRTRLSQARRTR